MLQGMAKEAMQDEEQGRQAVIHMEVRDDEERGWE